MSKVNRMSGTNEGRPTAEMIRAWLVDRVAGRLRCPAERIDVDDSFDRLGLDSATAVGLTLDLEDWLGRLIEPAILYDFRTIRRLADHLADEGQENSSRAGESA